MHTTIGAGVAGSGGVVGNAVDVRSNNVVKGPGSNPPHPVGAVGNAVDVRSDNVVEGPGLNPPLMQFSFNFLSTFFSLK